MTTVEGETINKPGFDSKDSFRLFREQKLQEYGLNLTPEQYNALTYVEGEGSDYTNKRRTMNELAAFCHMVDVWSALLYHNYPQPSGQDEWAGADRFRS